MIIAYLLIIVKIMKKEFDQNKYITEYKKNNYKQFKVDLPTEEKEEIDLFLKENNLNKTMFIREAYQLMKEKYSDDINAKFTNSIKEQVTKIITRYGKQRISINFPKNFNHDYQYTFDNGLVVNLKKLALSTMDKEYTYLAKITFENEIIYIGMMSYIYSHEILRKLESLEIKKNRLG